MSVDDIGGDVDEALADLGEDAQNKQVQLLVSILAEYNNRLARIEDRLDAISNYMEYLDDELSGLDTTEMPPGKWDRFDKIVFKRLQNTENETIRVGDVRKLYKKNTSIRRRETLNDRVQHLLEDGPFEEVEHQKWRYLRSESDRE